MNNALEFIKSKGLYDEYTEFIKPKEKKKKGEFYFQWRILRPNIKGSLFSTMYADSKEEVSEYLYEKYGDHSSIISINDIAYERRDYIKYIPKEKKNG